MNSFWASFWQQQDASLLHVFKNQAGYKTAATIQVQPIEGVAVCRDDGHFGIGDVVFIHVSIHLLMNKMTH